MLDETLGLGTWTECVALQSTLARAARMAVWDHRLGRSAKTMLPENVTLNPERAVMDISLCYRVGKVRSERYREHHFAAQRASYVYLLAGIAYCAHCGVSVPDCNDMRDIEHCRAIGTEIVALNVERRIAP